MTEARRKLSKWQRDGKPWFDEYTLNQLHCFIENENEIYHKTQTKKNIPDIDMIFYTSVNRTDEYNKIVEAKIEGFNYLKNYILNK